MNRRKEIIHTYKERKLCGGVYTITNTLNGMYLIDHVADLASAQNRFHFAVTTGSTVHPRLKEAWAESGVHAFSFEILERLEQGPEQSKTEFMADLRTLEQLWRANLDPSKEY